VIGSLWLRLIGMGGVVGKGGKSAWWKRWFMWSGRNVRFVREVKERGRGGKRFCTVGLEGRGGGTRIRIRIRRKGEVDQGCDGCLGL